MKLMETQKRNDEHHFRTVKERVVKYTAVVLCAASALLLSPRGIFNKYHSPDLLAFII